MAFLRAERPASLLFGVVEQRDFKSYKKEKRTTTARES